MNGPEAVQEAMARGRVAAAWWRNVPVKERSQRLLRFRRLLVDRVDDLVALVGRECDKPRMDVVNEVFQCANSLSYCVRAAGRILKPRRVSPFPLLNKTAVIEYRPLGVVAAITPWNYPVVLVLSPVGQAR